jgi:hypothetical protein
VNHVKKAEIVFPEVSDRKIHVNRKITVEAGKEAQPKPQSQWEVFCEGFTVAAIVTIGFIIFLVIANAMDSGK